MAGSKKKITPARAKRAAKPRTNPDFMLVRIAPYNAKRGFVLRRVVCHGHLFRADRGWYKVPKVLADMLVKVKQPPSRNYTIDEAPRAFDVKTVEEAQEVDEGEDAKESGRAEAPTELGPGRGDMSTKDLKTPAARGGTSSAGSTSGAAE